MGAGRVFLWGWFRFALGVCQMTLAFAAFWALASFGLDAITLGLVAGATGLALVSRRLYRGRAAPPEKEK